MTKSILATICCLILIHTMGIESFAQTGEVQVVGAMRNVMLKGELQATIRLDTIRNKQHLYGIGPVENLQGEILITDGRAYKATVQGDSSLRMAKGFDLGAPFFVYANVDRWQEYTLPDSVKTLPQLDFFLKRLTADKIRPFVFKLIGKAGKADMHVVNLPPNTKVKSMKDASQGQRNFKLRQADVVMIGFFSARHKGIFTHHDSNVHIHVITADETKMGHVDGLQLNSKAMKLYVSK